MLSYARPDILSLPKRLSDYNSFTQRHSLVTLLRFALCRARQTCWRTSLPQELPGALLRVGGSTVRINHFGYLVFRKMCRSSRVISCVMPNLTLIYFLPQRK